MTAVKSRHTVKLRNIQTGKYIPYAVNTDRLKRGFLRQDMTFKAYETQELENLTEAQMKGLTIVVNSQHSHPPILCSIQTLCNCLYSIYAVYTQHTGIYTQRWTQRSDIFRHPHPPPALARSNTYLPPPRQAPHWVTHLTLPHTPLSLSPQVNHVFINDT